MKTVTLLVILSVLIGRATSCTANNGQSLPGTVQTIQVPGVAADSAGGSGTTTAALLEQAKAADAQRYQFAIEHGARIVATSGGRSFVVVWFPAGPDGGKPPTIATIHGHGSWAFDEFFLWQPYAAERGYGIVALQWWFGQGERYQDYYSPEEVDRELSVILEREGVPPGTVLLHGFSRGSANIYAVTAADRASGRNNYLLTVANAGKPSPGFPPNVEIEQGKFGLQPLAGTNWVTFCGGRDEHPDRDGCTGMRKAAQWITRFGGIVLKAIEDPDADHGGFHRTPANVNTALEVFACELAERS